MNADKVEHRGIAAFQSVCGSQVLLVRRGTVIAKIPIDGWKTVEELEGIIDEYLEGSERG